MKDLYLSGYKMGEQKITLFLYLNKRKKKIL